MNSLHVIAALLFPAGVGLAVLADPILALYPSGEFGDAAAVLRVLGLWVVFLAPSYVGASFLTGAGRLGLMASVNLIAIALQGLLLALWVPRHGAVGAACAALAAFAVVAMVQLQACRLLGVRVPWAALLRAAAAALAMGALLWPLREGPLYGSVPLGAAVYALLYFAMAPRDGLERRLLAEGRLLWRRA
jgi:PST family polysaccharide transporter